MSLFKQKSTEFNFSKKSPPSSLNIKNKRKNIANIIFLGIIAICFIQTSFFVNGVMKTIEEKTNIEKKQGVVNQYFFQFSDSLRENKEKEVLESFIELKKQTIPTADVMASSAFLLTRIAYDEKRISAKTYEKIKELEENNMYSANDYTAEQLSKKQCFFADLYCSARKKSSIKEYEFLSSIDKNNIKANIYNANHLKEFYQWRNLIESKKGNATDEENLSPGKRFYQKERKEK